MPPSLDSVLGVGADQHWVNTDRNQQNRFSVHHDAAIGADVLTPLGTPYLSLQSRAQYGTNIEIRCRVRLATSATRTHCRFTLSTARIDDPTPSELSVSLLATHGQSITVTAPTLANRRYMHSNPDIIGGSDPGAKLYYTLRAYSEVKPTWEAIPRRTIAADMAELPAPEATWIRVRVQLGDDWIRMWIDDRLITDHRGADVQTAGGILMTLSEGCSLTGFAVDRLLPGNPMYEPIPLNGYVRDRTFLHRRGKEVGIRATSLPSGKTVTVHEIPFTFADPEITGGADHISVARSLLRQANMEGHVPVMSQGPRFAGSLTVDPARIQMRIPNGRYKALHLVAAFDEAKHHIPLVSAQFYRPAVGMSMVFDGIVPSYRAPVSPKALPVVLDNGKSIHLWHVTIPLDPGMLSSFADMGYLELELTKRVEQFRSYPDPIHYGWHGAGRPSGVHIYALTLERPVVHMEFDPALFGHVWTDTQVPEYHVRLHNRSTVAQRVQISVRGRSWDGVDHIDLHDERTIQPNVPMVVKFPMPGLKRFGYYDVEATLTHDGHHWTEKRSFVRLAPDTRPAEWTDGEGPLFGFWSYYGGHYTPPAEHHVRLMQLAGARAPKYPANAWPIQPQAWGRKEPLDNEQFEAYKTSAIAAIRERQGDNPAIITLFAEPHISRDLTAGNLPSYWGEPPYAMNDDEKSNLRMYMNTARSAAEAIREQWPDTPLLIPWGDPLFVVPMLRAGFPKELIDGSGIDICGFERLPEQQLHQISMHRLYLLREEFRRFGMDNPKLWFVEGIFVPTEPGAATWREQSNYYDRAALISMAYGIDRFYSSWPAFDCGSYYGSEHYGGCAIQRRIPYCNPKPAYASYATMTRALAGATFERWLPTGSLTVYCLRFRRPAEKGGPVHVLWTLRGKRPARLAVQPNRTVIATDSMDNAQPLAVTDGRATVTLGESVTYITGVDTIDTIELGAPDHHDAERWGRERNRETWQTGPLHRQEAPPHLVTVANPGDGGWAISDSADQFTRVYEDNNFDTHRFRGRMSATPSPGRAPHDDALAITLLAQETERKLMPWYTVVRPQKPVTIRGRADALGVWVRAASDWGRIIYCLRDANDEMWISIGFKDQWNCDDLHSWSAFNFDGWRYLRFELPGHAEWDSFRLLGTTWWRYAGGNANGVGVVDYPLRLEQIIVERRTHILYVNDIEPTHAEDNDVLIGPIVAEYANPAALNARRLRMPLPDAGGQLPNPIVDMTRNILPPTRITGVRPPAWGYDGTRCQVLFDEVASVADYRVWVGAEPDGTGAVEMATLAESGGLVNNLRPGMDLYLWLVYRTEGDATTDMPSRYSRPSAPFKINLVDAFAQK